MTTLRKLPLICGLLPTVTVWLGMFVLDEALVSVVLYHVGIIACMFWQNFELKQVLRGFDARLCLGVGGLCLLTWPLITVLWPIMVQPGVDLSALLVDWRIRGSFVGVFVVYSITLHPILEESFWRGMMPDHWKSDILFAGFHLLVLYPLVHAIWLPVVFGVLTVASGIWRWITRRQQGLLVPILTHALADLGVVLAVWMLLRAS
ncbi:CPBP family intramembrane metalloprotease [Kiritimatiellota bacterium B12222]|nr:CPBP family intramembrane metalloprotease [Kiritimatiellota bacterium B12222]